MITILIILGLFINIPLLIALFIGLQLNIENPKCTEEVNGVKNNIRTIKIVNIINVIIFLVSLLLSVL